MQASKLDTPRARLPDHQQLQITRGACAENTVQYSVRYAAAAARKVGNSGTVVTLHRTVFSAHTCCSEVPLLSSLCTRALRQLSAGPRGTRNVP
jgi:hypothetical protein